MPVLDLPDQKKTLVGVKNPDGTFTQSTGEVTDLPDKEKTYAGKMMPDGTFKPAAEIRTENDLNVARLNLTDRALLLTETLEMERPVPDFVHPDHLNRLREDFYSGKIDPKLVHSLRSDLISHSDPITRIAYNLSDTLNVIAQLLGLARNSGHSASK